MDKDMSIKNINDFLEDTDVKPLDKAISNSLYGFKHFGTKPILESNTDNQGFTFFTRPQLNLSTINIRNIRSFYSLLDKKRLSANRFVRVTLDPRLPYKLYIRGKEDFLYGDEIIDTPLVDKYNAFIPILSNTLKNMSGWPDMVVPTFTSSAGIRKEQISMIDGSYEILDSFDLTATFKNFQNEPLTLLFNTWVKYASLCFEGMMYPYIDTILENEFDYNTRIYRFVMDKSGTIIKKWSATGASFPYTFPSGKFYDFADDKPYSDQTGEININFKCMGAMYNEDILLKEFNQTSAIFNPYVRAFINKEYDKISIIPDEILPLMNYRGYPVIDLDTRKFIWITNKGNKTLTRILNNLKAQAEQRRQEAYAREQARKGLNKELDDNKNKLISGYEKYNKKELAERKARLKVTEPTIPAPVKVEIKEALYEEPVNKPIKKAIKKDPIKKIRTTQEANVEKAVTSAVTKPIQRKVKGWTKNQIANYTVALRKKLKDNNTQIDTLTKEALALKRKRVALTVLINNMPEGNLKDQYLNKLSNIDKAITMKEKSILEIKSVNRKIKDSILHSDLLSLPKNERTGTNALQIKEATEISNTLNNELNDLDSSIKSLNNDIKIAKQEEVNCRSKGGTDCDKYVKKQNDLIKERNDLNTLLNQKTNEYFELKDKIQKLKDEDKPIPPMYKSPSDVPTPYESMAKVNHEVNPPDGFIPDTSTTVIPHVDPPLTKEQIDKLHQEGKLTNKEIDNKISQTKDKIRQLKQEYTNEISNENDKNTVVGMAKIISDNIDAYSDDKMDRDTLKAVVANVINKSRKNLQHIANVYGKDSPQYKAAVQHLEDAFYESHIIGPDTVKEPFTANDMVELEALLNSDLQDSDKVQTPPLMDKLNTEIEKAPLLTLKPEERNDPEKVAQAYHAWGERANKKIDVVKAKNLVRNISKKVDSAVKNSTDDTISNDDADDIKELAEKIPNTV